MILAYLGPGLWKLCLKAINGLSCSATSRKLMRQYSFVGLAALGAAFTWLNALAVYTPYMEQVCTCEINSDRTLLDYLVLFL